MNINANELGFVIVSLFVIVFAVVSYLWIVDFCSDSNGRLVPLSETARKNLLGDSVAQVYGLWEQLPSPLAGEGQGEGV